MQSHLIRFFFPWNFDKLIIRYTKVNQQYNKVFFFFLRIEGRVRVLTVTGIKTLFKTLLIKIQPWLTKTDRDQQNEGTIHRIWEERRGRL